MATAPHQLSTYDKTKVPNGKSFKVGIVVSEWNTAITEGLYKGALQTLTDCGVLPENITRWDVPGSFELVYGCRHMLRTQTHDVIIAIGSVIRGETAHFDFVCHGVTQGIANLNATQDTPIIFCVLTDNTMAQAEARSGGILGNKGVEAAVAALKMAGLRHRAAH